MMTEKDIKCFDHVSCFHAVPLFNIHFLVLLQFSFRCANAICNIHHFTWNREIWNDRKLYDPCANEIHKYVLLKHFSVIQISSRMWIIYESYLILIISTRNEIDCALCMFVQSKWMNVESRFVLKRQMINAKVRKPHNDHISLNSFIPVNSFYRSTNIFLR